MRAELNAHAELAAMECPCMWASLAIPRWAVHVCELAAIAQVAQGAQESAAPTLATRACALQLLLALLDATTANAPGDTAAALLQLHVQPIVQCAFAVTEDSVETLKPDALEVLARVLEATAAIGSPALVGAAAEDEGAEADEGLQLDVLAAPYVTALKTCLRPDAPVATATAAVRLSEVVLRCGMLSRDPKSLQV